MLVTASTDLFLFTKMVSKEDHDILLALKEKTSIHKKFAGKNWKTFLPTGRRKTESDSTKKISIPVISSLLIFREMSV